MRSMLEMLSLRSSGLEDSWVDKCEAYDTDLSCSYTFGSLRHLDDNEVTGVNEIAMGESAK